MARVPVASAGRSAGRRTGTTGLRRRADPRGKGCWACGITRRLSRLPLGSEIIGPVLDYIYADSRIKAVLDAFEHPRPLRLVFVGRTGAGKSSVINALTGKCLAEVSDPVRGSNRRKSSIADGEQVLGPSGGYPGDRRCGAGSGGGAGNGAQPGFAGPDDLDDSAHRPVAPG